VDRRWESSIEPLLRKVETRLTAAVCGLSQATSPANLVHDGFTTGTCSDPRPLVRTVAEPDSR
jgi:hypothetical protein